MKKIFLILSVFTLSACSDGKPLNPAGIDQASNNTQFRYAPAGDLILVEDLQNDLTELNALLDSVHPDPGFTMDVTEVKFQIDKLAKQITAPMTQLEAWKYFSQLNPYFQDGHMAIFYPDYSQRLDQHIDNGGRVFPVKVNIDKSHDLYVTAVQNVDEGIRVGDKIVTINGVDASEIVENILNRIHGDTVSNRMAIASERFAKMHWLLYGDSGYYQFDVRDHGEVKRYSVIGSDKKAGETGLNIDEFVQREVLENHIGYLRVNRFYFAPEHEEAYFSFMEDSWQEFHDANVQDVIIDVRNNPGGTDHYWQQAIAPYVASEPFLFLSQFKIRMTERNLRLGPFKGEPGTIVEGSFDQLVTVDGDSGLRIPGKAYLLMGSLSYSSTILFLTALQDSGQAVIAGQSSGARSCTTGRIQISRLSASQLEITLPSAIFTRPSGNNLCHQPVKPDIFIFDDPFNPGLAVTELAKEIDSRRD